MSLREEITDILEIYGQGYSKRSFEQAVDKILALPSLQETIEKAEKYDKLFSGLKVEEKCKECCGTGKEICDNPDHGLINAMGVRLMGHANGCPCCGNDELHRTNTVCNICNGTGEILRELTEDEKEEVLKIIMTCVGCDYGCLNSGARVVRG